MAVVACGPGELGGRDDSVGGMEVGLEHRPVALAEARQDMPEGGHVGLGRWRRCVGGGQLGHALVHEGAQLDEILVDAAAADFKECLAPLNDTTTELPLEKGGDQVVVSVGFVFAICRQACNPFRSSGVGGHNCSTIAHLRLAGTAIFLALALYSPNKWRFCPRPAARLP